MKSAAVYSIRSDVLAFSVHPPDLIHSRKTAKHVHIMEDMPRCALCGTKKQKQKHIHMTYEHIRSEERRLEQLPE